MTWKTKPTLALLMILALPASAVAAGGVEVAPFVGVLFEGELEAGDPDFEFDKDSAYGITIGIPVLGADKVELMYSSFESPLRSKGPGRLRAAEVDFTYWHVGGHWEHGDGPTKLFAVASGGIVEIDPDGSFYRSKTLPSAGFGGGAKYFFHDFFGVKGEGRIMANYIDGSRDLICNPEAGCLGRVSGSFLWQLQASVGVVFKF